MIVTRILGDCPGCGHSQSYGNVDVFNGVLVRGCGYCDYSDNLTLPPVRKKTIYLDQFFFSHAFRGNEQRFVSAAERIQAIAAAQLLAAPRSNLHEQETMLWNRSEELYEFIKATSRGAKFEPAYRVEHTQLVRAFRAWLDNGPVEYVLDERDAIDGNLHKWDGYFRIEVGRWFGDIDQVRNSKHQAIRDLLDTFGDWRNSTSTFEQDVATENTAAGKGYMDAYLRYAMRVGSGDYAALSDSPVMSQVVESMMHILPKDMAPEQRLQTCESFFSTEHFKNAPYQFLSTRMYAALKAMVKDGAYANVEKARTRLSGFFLDVNHIATYAPYCDAIIIDKQMAELVARPEVSLEKNFPVKVFNLNRWSAIFDWLDEIEAGMNDFHKAALAAIYP